MKEIRIGKRRISARHPVFIIAELSCNHLQDYDLAVRSIRAIKQAGADAVKLQTFKPDTITLNSKKRYFRIKQGTLWDGESLYELYKKVYTPWEWQPKLKKIAEGLGLVCFSSALDKSAVDFLENMGAPAYKIPSFEISDIPLIEYVASKNKPVLLSTGVAMLSDIQDAVSACKKMHNNRIIILKCVSNYPADLNEANLRAILDIGKRFKTLVGLSDHTLGPIAPIVAVSLGAMVIEKHFILDKKLKSPDSAFSSDFNEFKEMVAAIRKTESALGKIDYCLTPKANKNRDFRRSLFAIKDIKKDEALTKENIRSIRPGFGLPPKYMGYIIGKKSKINLKCGTPLSWEALKIKKNLKK